MTRRQLMGFLSSLGLARQAGAASTANKTAAPVAAGTPETWHLSEAQWRERLDAAQFRVLREEATERRRSVMRGSPRTS